MKRVFADTSYWIAVTRPGDPWSAVARRAREQLGPARLVTTDEVLGEFLAGLCSRGSFVRDLAVRMVQAILASPEVEVCPQSRASFLRGLERYRRRADKAYSLVDCVSMNVMEAKGISAVLSTDRHFVGEGFTALMLSTEG